MSHIHPPKGIFAQKAKFLAAVSKGDVDEAERMLTQLKLTGRGDPTNVKTEEGLYPIHMAAAVGSEAVCRMLVRHGANVNQLTEIIGKGNEGRTCLHFAAMSGVAGCIRYLIAAGADPHKKDLFGKSPYSLCRDKMSLRYLGIAMESWNNVLISGDLLRKALMAQLLILDTPSVSIDSPHPRRLETTYDTWYNELAQIRKVNGVHIPKPTPPKPSFLRQSKNNFKIGQYIIVDKRAETGTMNCFSGIVHAKTIEYLDEMSILIEAIFVRKDNRRQRTGTLLMYNLMSVFARRQYCHAIASIADSNHVAQTFFKKMGFKSLMPDAVPHAYKKNLHTFFEVQYMGINLGKIEHYLAHYIDVKIIDDDDHLAEENERVRDARQRRIDEKKNAKREARESEHGAFYKQLEDSLGVNGEKAQKVQKGLGEEVGWWMKDPPVPQFYNGKQIPLIYLPKPPTGVAVDAPFLPPMPPESHYSDSPVVARRNNTISRKETAESNSLPQLGNKALEDNNSQPQLTLKVTSELDRVPEHVLKQYEKEVLQHRDLAHEAWKLARKNEGRQSKILRHEIDETRREYISEFDHYKACYTVKRNLFPEGVVGAAPKPKFDVENTQAPHWNTGSKKSGFNFTRGRPKRSKTSLDKLVRIGRVLSALDDALDD